MPLFKKLFDFYLDASIHVALAVVALYWSTTHILNTSVNFNYVFFLGCGTIVCYNFMKYGVEAEKYLIVKRPYHKTIQIFSFLCFGIALYFFYRLDSNLYAPILFLTVLSGLYGLPFLPTSRNLRSLGGFKIFLVALVWVGFTVWVPILDAEIDYVFSSIFLGLQYFILTLILFIPFEIRDLRYDSVALKTMPQRLGVQKSVRLGYVLVLIYFLLTFAIAPNKWDVLISHLCTAILLLFLLRRSGGKQSAYFASFWVEAVPIFLVLFLSIFAQLG